MKIEITDQIAKEDEKTIFEGLLHYNLARLENTDPRELGVYLRNEDGGILAGLTGETYGNWLTIHFLWVREDLRDQKIGSRLLIKAEETAKSRGCRYVFLDTFGFQAPDFYRKHGYQDVFALTDYPVSGKRFYFTKQI